MEQISLDSALEISDAVGCRELDGEAVLEQHGRLRAVFERMLPECAVDPDVLKRGLIRLVERFGDQGLGTMG